ncbi:MAG TPA: polyprenyl synthetase family protein, partial [Luteolibacter sp.]|nr:polyprenyl synthetase family protein [Luteolibacter sp.]
MKTSPHAAASSLFPFELVRPQLERVEVAIRDQIRLFDPAVEPYVAYVCNTSGKRIRPALAALVGGATGGVSDDHVKLGVIMELIHMATLVHDDIIDGADTRRMVPTANAKWGNSLSVLLGDALFSHALTLATDFGCIEISRQVGNASREVCQGEIIQT